MASERISLYGTSKKHITENDLEQFHECQTLDAKNLADRQTCEKRLNNELFEKIDYIEKRMENVERDILEIKQMLFELLNNDKIVSTPLLRPLEREEFSADDDKRENQQMGFFTKSHLNYF